MNPIMRERRAVIATIAKRYQHSTKLQRGVILDEFNQTTGDTRTYGIRVPASWLNRKVLTIGGVSTIFVLGLKKPKGKGKKPPKRTGNLPVCGSSSGPGACGPTTYCPRTSS